MGISGRRLIWRRNYYYRYTSCINLFGDFESDRKSFRCRAMPANIPHGKCVVNTLKLKIFHLYLHCFLRSNDDFFGYYGGDFICMNDALNQWCQTFFVYGPISYFSVLTRATGLNYLDSIIFLACTIRILPTFITKLY